MIASVKSLGYFVNRVRIDNDTVFLSKDFTSVCAAEGIPLERTLPYAHWQLDMIKRKWQTLADVAKTLLLMADPPNRVFGGMPFLQWYTSETTVGPHDLAGFQRSLLPVTNPTSANYASLAALLMSTLTPPYGQNLGTKHGRESL